MRRRACLTGPAALAILLAASHTTWAANSPKDIVEDLYRQSARKPGAWDSALLKAAVRKRVFSKDLLREWEAADATNRRDEPGWLDFDLMSNSQDPSVNGLRVTVLNESAAKITVRASFRVDPAPKSRTDQVFYDFVMEDGSWKLDDIRGNPGADQWSARKLVRDAAAPKH